MIRYALIVLAVGALIASRYVRRRHGMAPASLALDETFTIPTDPYLVGVTRATP